MSDDRFVREPGDDTDEIHADRTYVDPKPRSWYQRAPQPTFDLAAECDKFIDSFCAKFGLKREAKRKERVAEPEKVEQQHAPTREEWQRLQEQIASGEREADRRQG